MANSELFFFHWPPNKSPKKQISIGFKIVFPVKIVHDNYPCSPDLRVQCCHDKTKLFEMVIQHLRCWPLDRLGSEEGIPLQVPSPNFPSQHLQTTIKGVVGILFTNQLVMHTLFEFLFSTQASGIVNCPSDPLLQKVFNLNLGHRNYPNDGLRIPPRT